MYRTLFVATAAVTLAISGTTFARDKTNRDAALPSLDQVKPLPLSALPSGAAEDAGFFHNFQLSAEGSYGEVRHKAGQPAALRQYSTGMAVGLSFDMGDYAFASITGNFSSNVIKSKVVQFPLDISANAYSRGLDAIIGVKPLPWLRAGFIGGTGNGNAGYTFTAFGGGSNSASEGQRLGGFVGATYVTGPVALSADLVYLNIRNRQDYGPNNTPQIATWGSDLLSLSLGASYRVLPQLTLSAGLGLNHIMKQTVAPADTANDINWASLQLGATYAVTENLDVKLSGSTWLNNNKFDYSRVALGLTYKF